VATERGDLLQGTLDMLVLKALHLEPMHGWGITDVSSNGRSAYCSWGKARSIPLCTDSNAKASFDPNGRSPRTTGVRAITR
jgi:hypothetical protein